MLYYKTGFSYVTTLTFSPLYRPVPAALDSPSRRPKSTSATPPFSGRCRPTRLPIPGPLEILLLCT